MPLCAPPASPSGSGSGVAGEGDVVELSDSQRAAARIMAMQRWFALATVEPNGSPTPSYVPFAVIGSAFGMVASRLAGHTANLLARRPASIMLVDGDEPHNAYARARLSISVSVAPQPRGSVEADAIWSALEARHGETAGVLRSLPDFEAIALHPAGGRLVLGFASAHHIDAAGLVAAMRAII